MGIGLLRAKGLAEEAIKHLINLYSNNITIVGVNNVLGRKFENKRWSIRQGDRPSSVLFCSSMARDKTPRHSHLHHAISWASPGHGTIPDFHH